MPTPEREIINAVIREYGTRADMRLWRSNTGSAVPIETVKRAIQFIRSGNISEGIRILQSRVVTFGVPGQADLTGILPGGTRLEIETKNQFGRQSEAQQNFQAMISRFGGKYILARSVDDVKTELHQYGS